MRVEASLAELERVTAYVTDTLTAQGCSARVCMQFALAVEEIFVNIAHYAYTDGGMAEVLCWVRDGRAAVRFTDSGVPFDPLKRTDPDVAAPAAERDIGGLGIYMVKKSMDEVTYAYAEGHNVLTLYKDLV